MSTFKPFVVLLALFLAAGSAFAGPGDRHQNRRGFKGKGHAHHQGNGWGHHKGDKKKNKKSHDVPELDPNAAGAAMILLIGGTLVLLERRR